MSGKAKHFTVEALTFKGVHESETSCFMYGFLV